MDKFKVPLSVVIGLLGAVFGAGSAVALAKSQASENADTIAMHSKKIEATDDKIEDLDRRLVRMEILIQGQTESLKRIERKLDHER